LIDAMIRMKKAAFGPPFLSALSQAGGHKKISATG
jgi:hypothetical protein